MSRPGESLEEFTQRALIAHGHVAPGEDVVFVHNDPSFDKCRFCGKEAELRMGMCYTCFSEGTPREKALGVKL